MRLDSRPCDASHGDIVRRLLSWQLSQEKAFEKPPSALGTRRLPCPVRLGWMDTRRDGRSIPARYPTRSFMAVYGECHGRQLDAGGDSVSIPYPFLTRKSPASYYHGHRPLGTVQTGSCNANGVHFPPHLTPFFLPLLCKMNPHMVSYRCDDGYFSFTSRRAWEPRPCALLHREQPLE